GTYLPIPSRRIPPTPNSLLLPASPTPVNFSSFGVRRLAPAFSALRRARASARLVFSSFAASHSPLLYQHSPARRSGPLLFKPSTSQGPPIRAGLPRRFSELAVFDARLYIRVRRIDEPA